MRKTKKLTSNKSSALKPHQNHLLVLISIVVFMLGGVIWLNFKANRLLLNSQVTSPGEIPNPTSIHPTTPNSQQKIVPTVNPDPIVNCKAQMGSKCEGQSVKLKKSQCLSMRTTYACCQIGNMYKILTKTECFAAQNSETTSTMALLLKLLAKRKEIEGNSSPLAGLEQEINAKIKKMNDDFEEYKKLSENTVSEFKNYKETTMNNLKQQQAKDYAELMEKLKQSEQIRKEELYKLCLSSVEAAYPSLRDKIIGDQYTDTTKKYIEELTQCSILYK